MYVCVCVCVCVYVYVYVFVCLCVVRVSSGWAEALRHLLAAAGGVELLTDMLLRHADHAGVAEAACGALWHLTVSGARPQRSAEQARRGGAGRRALRGCKGIWACACMSM